MSAAAAAPRIDYLAAEGPYGELFPRAQSAAERAAHRLSEARVISFREQGYVHAVPIMDARQVERLREGLERIVGGRNGRENELTGSGQLGGRLTYMQGAWMIDEAIHDLVFHPAITVKVAQLLGAQRARFFHDQVFYKPPRIGGNVAWHQDYSYWRRTTPSQHISVWIGLDDSRLDNGCLHVVPGSHRWPLLEPTALGGDMDKLSDQFSPDLRAAFKPIPLEQPAGTCSFHHDHTVHGSYENRSERPRRAIILNYFVDGTRSAAEDGLIMPGAPLVVAGKRIAGRWFPLVHDER
jgi:ectoine hydroxylase-related dioxygenase (phytanoyl-CoA dioxygenase family)